MKETVFEKGLPSATRRLEKKGLKETVIKIENEAGEKQLGKPQGIYITPRGRKHGRKRWRIS
ncbi:MAG: hypothetical protein ACLRYY_06475 [Anaerobutyricum soehngenii]